MLNLQKSAEGLHFFASHTACIPYSLIHQVCGEIFLFCLHKEFLSSCWLFLTTTGWNLTLPCKVPTEPIPISVCFGSNSKIQIQASHSCALPRGRHQQRGKSHIPTQLSQDNNSTVTYYQSWQLFFIPQKNNMEVYARVHLLKSSAGYHMIFEII